MCSNPDFPVYDLSCVPSSEPVRCANCGAELELVCTGPTRCPAPLGANNQVRVGRQTRQYPKAAPRSDRSYRPKPCARCLKSFQPTGPRSLYCARADCSPPTSPLEATP